MNVKLLTVFIVSFLVNLGWTDLGRTEGINPDQWASALQEGKKLVELYCHSESGEFDQCTQGIQALEQVIQHDPHNLQALLLLMKAYRNLSWEKGLDVARQLLKLDPNNGEAYFFIGTFTDSPEEKISYLRKAAQLIPNDPCVHGTLAWALLYYNEGSLEEVLTEMKRQIAVNGATSMILDIADELFDRGSKAEAREVYIAYLHSAQLERRTCGAFAEAVSQEEMEQLGILSVFLDQCGGHGYYKLALKEGDLEKKIALLKKALELSPDHKEAQRELEKALGTPQGGRRRRLGMNIIVLKVFLVSFFVSLWWTEGTEAKPIDPDQSALALSEGKTLIELYCHSEQELRSNSKSIMNA